MSSGPRRALLVALALGALCGPARAQDLKDRFNIRLGLSAMYLREDQPGEQSDLKKIPGPLQLAYGDLRAILDARRLPGGFELHVDVRLRGTGRLLKPQEIEEGTTQTTARGYLGGPEFQIYELYARGRWSKIDLGLGRQLVIEADALRLDGARLWIHAHKRWDVSVYAGTYPDPYSRSLLSDYVSGSDPGAGIAAGGGLSARYSYDRIYGSFSANPLYLGGENDGGPIAPEAQLSLIPGNSPASSPGREGVRAFLTWSNFWRPIKYIDLFHDLVLDVAGSAGVQLTRLDAFAAIHVHRNVTLRLGYDHMSSLALEMYLARLMVRDRTLLLPGAIETNLTISRTARDEGRLALETQFGKTTLTGEGRFRRRAMVDPSNDPQFVFQAPHPEAGKQVAPSLAYDVTVALRNRGSLWALRPSLWITYLQDYRARNIYAGIALGRDFLADRLSVDLSFTYANTRDEGVAGAPGCEATPLTQAAILPQLTALQGCFGTRRGHNLQPGLTLTAVPSRRWYVFFDYRTGIALSEGIPAVFTHVLLARVEARY